MTADFCGLFWNSPTRIKRLISSEKGFRSTFRSGIKEVRVGQFAESPAVLRISFVASDPHILKNVAIAAGPGILKVSWGPASPSILPALAVAEAKDGNANPPLAPPIKRSVTALAAPGVSPPVVAQGTSSEKTDRDFPGKTDRDSEPLAPSSARKAFHDLVQTGEGGEAVGNQKAKNDSAKIESSTYRLKRTELNSENGGAGGAIKSALTNSNDPPPVISLVPCDNLGSNVTMEVLRIEMPAGRSLNCRTFRLHNPERYVVDIPDCQSMAEAEMPDLSASPLVSSLRVGALGGAEGMGRLVLELKDNQVNVQDRYTPGSNYLSITLGKGLMLGPGGGQTRERFSSGEITPGPIVVPKAPDETVVVLDAGHGGSDPGAMRADVQEKDITLGIIEKLQKILEAKGARVVLTRHDDTFVSLEDRAKITNAVAPNLFLSVHINSLESTSNIYGIETYFQTEISRPLAERVHASLVAGLAAPDRNIRRARFYVINHTPVPAILAEVGYITNKAERDRLNSSDYQAKVASALARGVMLYLQDTGVASGQLANSARGQSARNTQ